MRERRLRTGRVKYKALHLKTERSSADDIPKRSHTQRRTQRKSLPPRRPALRHRSDNVKLRPRMRQNLVDPRGTQDIIEQTGQNSRYFRRLRPWRVLLVVYVAVMTPRESSYRVSLREARHPPASNRRPDEMHRPRARCLKKFAK
jgi:hypothetical protein